MGGDENRGFARSCQDVVHRLQPGAPVGELNIRHDELRFSFGGESDRLPPGAGDANDVVDQVQVAMNSRAEIEQAKGILMARSHCDADRAFDILRRASQRQNVKLRQIAHTIVVNTAAGLTSMTP